MPFGCRSLAVVPLSARALAWSSKVIRKIRALFVAVTIELVVVSTIYQLTPLRLNHWSTEESLADLGGIYTAMTHQRHQSSRRA
ncbi:unnamed protein product [Schistocephalus solidus]|uniref:Secreted protein n=1 Tax=Schistocephalus solidus TaxID=70667 RepID=A0A183TSM0_SCHSO|nr:unnamed protein product [Schistocephalus solidus]